MDLCLDVGNSHIYGGVFEKEVIQLRFRYASKQSGSSDQLGLFLRAVLGENNVDYHQIKRISACSVVPELDYSLRSACSKYFSITPFFLEAGVKTGLNIKYRNPSEVGADRIANAIAAVRQFPDKNIIIVDFGTATTCCVITKDKSYLGGVILPGMKLSRDVLQSNTAKLFAVEIIEPEVIVGRSTQESIQSGLYYMQLGAVKELLSHIKKEAFKDEIPIVIGTGGFSNLYTKQEIFTVIEPDLVLQGLRLVLELNGVQE
ncbi:MAG: pantothenate kinase [Gammaproteobacteria bacterium RIFCSPHIGHO2_12_FULL_35_23]|nr:MAG: pantothenate kinase [Gammaproteobacteria bacterium RIFCSPHIGHO2_12_FULL_35_23]